MIFGPNDIVEIKEVDQGGLVPTRVCLRDMFLITKLEWNFCLGNTVKIVDKIKQYIFTVHRDPGPG